LFTPIYIAFKKYLYKYGTQYDAIDIAIRKYDTKFKVHGLTFNQCWRIMENCLDGHLGNPIRMIILLRDINRDIDNKRDSLYSTFVKVYQYFVNKSEMAENSVISNYVNLRHCFTDVIYDAIYEESIEDLTRFVEIKNDFTKTLFNIYIKEKCNVPNFDGTTKMCYKTKKIVERYADVLLDDKYRLQSQNDFSEAYLYCYKLVIMIFIEWKNRNYGMSDEDIMKLDAITLKRRLRVNSNLYCGQYMATVKSDIIEKKDDVIYNMISCLETLKEKYNLS
jgi:hypothetical protein